MERLVDYRNGSPANTTGVSDRPVAGASSSLISPTTGTSSVPLPSRSQRRHAAAEESFERSLLLLLVLFALLGGSTIIAEVTVAGTEVEPEDPVVNTEEPASDLATVSGVMDRNDQEGFASDDYASWLGESGQYESGQYDAQ